MIFTREKPEEVVHNNKSGILNFQNLYSVYLFNKDSAFKRLIISPGNFIFPDGKVLSTFLKSKQARGPTFTKNFLENQISKNQKHFFILPEPKDLKMLVKRFPKLKNSQSYSPPYIKGSVFPEKETQEISKQLKSFKPNYVWVCIGNPKQEILSNQLYKKYKAFYFNIGAATDFLISKKKEAPSIFRKLGVEWFYRLITDFKYSRKKVWGSIVGLKYLSLIKIKSYI